MKAASGGLTATDERVIRVLEHFGIGAHHFSSCSGDELWSSDTRAGVLQSMNPTTGQVLAEIYAGSEHDYEALVTRSLDCWQRWRQVPAPKRAECVRHLAASLREHKEWLGSLISIETGKILEEGLGEVQEMIDMADFAVGQARMLYGRTMHSERAQHRMYEQWHPLGPVGIITAFNFPMAVWAWNAFLAVVCGDTVIWKPSPKAPLCALAVQKLCNAVMKDLACDGLFSLFIPKDTASVERLVEDIRIPLISYTGSSVVGRDVGVRVARRFGRSMLELSGNNAVLVDASANLDLAIPAIVFGFVGTAGQRCTSTRRVLVHESRYEEFQRRLLDAVSQIRIGDPLEADTLMGPLIDAQAVATYLAAIAEVRGLGGKVLAGGEPLKRPGNFVTPTLVSARNEWAVVQRETFGPLLYLMKVKDLHEAIRLQNAVPQGLSSSLFTESLRSAEIFLAASGSDCGIANINIGTSGAEIGGAFGGEKETGGGREAGSDSWRVYMRRQTNTINWGAELPLAQGIRFGLEKR